MGISRSELKKRIKNIDEKLENAGNDEKKISEIRHEWNNLEQLLYYTDIKTLKVSKFLHEKIKEAAKNNNMSIYDMTNKILTEGLRMLLVCFICLPFVGCGTQTKTKYVHVDKVPMERYNHDQKFRPGMTQKEVMAMFGSPDVINKKYYSGPTIQWVYKNEIFCKGYRCFIYFNTNGLTTSSTHIRQEFDPEKVSLD